jgi:hypothetical protein
MNHLLHDSTSFHTRYTFEPIFSAGLNPVRKAFDTPLYNITSFTRFRYALILSCVYSMTAD